MTLPVALSHVIAMVLMTLSLSTFLNLTRLAARERRTTAHLAAEQRRRHDELLRAALRRPVHLPGTTARVGASVGVAGTAAPVDHEALLRRADAAMYEDKRRRRAEAGTAAVRSPG
ncbi:hypothetical protein [Kineococcus sp. G2]|uniref:hypothetical protein n=1 Tax=Kineococcus sp. G2 TaxID=3127484 RepID=UPI00301C93B2